MVSDLRLRPLRNHDEAAAVAAQHSMAQDDFDFLLDYTSDEAWDGYLNRLLNQSRGVDLPADRVPATFLAATVGDVLVGRLSIRHELNDYLARYGGHIGYGVIPEFRRRGHATAMLSQGLVVARSLGVTSVLITCDDDNVGSVLAIERNGGLLESVVDRPGGRVPLRRYWVHESDPLAVQ